VNHLKKMSAAIRSVRFGLSPGFSRRLGVSLAAALLSFLPDSSQAAQQITAHVDASGRVVFVNEGENPPVTIPVVSSEQSKKIVASTTDPAATMPVPSPATAYGTSEPSPSIVQAPGHLNGLIEEAAFRHQIDPDLIRAIIRVESNFDPNAVSPAGARGLMQLIPSTAMRFGVQNAFDPRSNLDGGIRYLKHLLGLYQGNLQLSLAAYNAGEQAVARSGGVPRYRETQDYIRKITQLYPLRPIAAGLPAEPKIEKFVDGSGVVHFSNIDHP
jgi:soluble lytic murein transglycosylase-like protein